MIVFIKPLSVNQAWKGRRFKTPEYTQYEKDMMWLLPKVEVRKGRLSLIIHVGYSNPFSDIDNFLKPFIDVLQKKYKFNDNQIYELCVYKHIVANGKEYIDFEIINL